jgi:hypothetical protein
MKTLHKIVLLAGAVSAALTIRREVRRIRDELAREDALPVLLPVTDAEPASLEPLQPDDLRVAQNAPL